SASFLDSAGVRFRASLTKRHPKCTHAPPVWTPAPRRLMKRLNPSYVLPFVICACGSPAKESPQQDTTSPVLGGTNILVVADNKLFTFSRSGASLTTPLAIPQAGDGPTRDVVVDPTGRRAFFNGTFFPKLSI